ncbi:MAG: hypothetical protein KJ573_04130 [Proteobacteria bacterium]|nr:hypothetical protein [Pseudomonadota bacterium]
MKMKMILGRFWSSVRVWPATGSPKDPAAVSQTNAISATRRHMGLDDICTPYPAIQPS